MRSLFSILLLFLPRMLNAQVQNIEPDEMQEQNIENLAESTETETEDEYDQQQLLLYKSHPLNINGPESELEEFPLFEPLQIGNLIKYRKMLGDLISVYELQSVPGFSVELIRKILPYIAVAASDLTVDKLMSRLGSGDRTMVIRSSIIPEKAKGFHSGDPSPQKFRGGRGKIMVRYKYQYRDLFQYGVVADQDAGEKFTFNRRQAGFDFYSIHLFARKLGNIKAIALGDYTVNFGQGLIQWQSQAYNKSASVINIKRESEVLRPYHSAGEYNFFRGIGTTVSISHLQGTLFASYRRLSANVEMDGSAANMTSIQTSGLHRTLSEIEDRNTVGMTAVGGNLKWQHGSGHIGVNAVQYHYSIPFLKRQLPYNLHAITGNSWRAYSMDCSFTYRNYHLFGEFAMDRSAHKAMIAGLMTSLDPVVDLALLFRSLDPAYQSLYGNAFTENTLPSNETGIYIGSGIKPSAQWKIDVYADVFRFPWLRYRVDAPGYGSECLFQATWQPAKAVEVYTKLRLRIKPLNNRLPGHAINSPEDRELKNWRTHISFQLTKDILLRNRVELSWYGSQRDSGPERGFLFYSDVLYKPFGKPYSISARFIAFETGGYDTRIYAYENDVLFSSSSPAFFGKGARVYLNIKARPPITLLKEYQVDLGIKLSTSVYEGGAPIGSGPDEIEAPHKSEIKVQLLFASRR